MKREIYINTYKTFRCRLHCYVIDRLCSRWRKLVQILVIQSTLVALCVQSISVIGEGETCPAAPSHSLRQCSATKLTNHMFQISYSPCLDSSGFDLLHWRNWPGYKTTIEWWFIQYSLLLSGSRHWVSSYWLAFVFFLWYLVIIKQLTEHVRFNMEILWLTYAMLAAYSDRVQLKVRITQDME